jgi:entry exclusion lipoprotein TrbK
MRTTIQRFRCKGACFVFVALACAIAGCGEKLPNAADIKGANVPKLDPKVVRAKMADAMGRMNAAGGFKRIDPNH